SSLPLHSYALIRRLHPQPPLFPYTTLFRSPTEVVIIGAGVAGTVAARAAMALGALVKVFDDDIDKLRNIRQTLGQTLFTSTLQRSEEHTSELQSRENLVCRLLLEKKKEYYL